jgi:hypothetical protein
VKQQNKGAVGAGCKQNAKQHPFQDSKKGEKIQISMICSAIKCKYTTGAEKPCVDIVIEIAYRLVAPGLFHLRVGGPHSVIPFAYNAVIEFAGVIGRLKDLYVNSLWALCDVR